ncbi:MAG: thioredoxin 1 [Halobacteriales archaeon]|jgi:thioredoxin 1
MSDPDELEEIKQRKLEELQEQGAAGSEDASRASNAPDDPIHVDDADHFQSIVNDHDVVVVDFHADWCGPCKMMEPVMNSLAAETDAAVAKIDIDRLQRLAQQHGVRGVPTFKVYANGEQIEQFVGAQDRSVFERLIDQYAS